MYSDDGDFFKRIKSLLTNGKSGEEKSVSADAEVDQTTDVLVDEQEVELEAKVTVKQQIQSALEQRESRVNLTENVSETPPVTLRTVPVTAPAAVAVSAPVEDDLDIRFATKFIEAGGKFIFCENMKDVVDSLKVLKQENNWGHIFSWENEIKDVFSEYNFQRGAIGFTIENSDAAISLCESLISDEGIIVLNPKQASRRRLPCFPKTHIIITDVAHLVGTETQGLDQFFQKHKGELPSIIKLDHCNNGHFYDKQRLILNAEGPEDVYVILVDEIIPPSLRP